ncbi:uncharacterized protein LOC105662428 [Megachile rotundata]|uniref:uncharacterized protein LOC105662428 n=1 Tax=Megachile rotundata TaxID=143995 RepID=UPI003FD41D0F
MCFQKRLRNGKLLIAAGEGKLEEVKKLVKEGADINFSDTEGNTVLHYAVESCNLEVVQHVINEMYVDIDIENNENRTPLNIAKESKKQDIMEAIEEKVLCNALNNLETVISSNTINESILQVETDVKGKIIKKIQVSLQALEELTKSEEDIKKFTHKNANVFLLFLEAFALQDVEINNEIEKAQKDELIKCFGQKNYELIRSLRTRLVHPKDTNMIIEPKNLQKLTKMHSSVAKVFISLKNYAEEVSESLNKKQSKSDIKDLTEILLDSEIHKSKSKLTKNIYNLFERLVKVAYSTNVKQEELEEAMFDLIVNIIPFLSQEGVPENLQKLKDLRNELFHNFHEYKNLKVRKLELKKSISNLRSDIFKYYYSQRVHDVLQCSSCCIDSEGIKKDLDEKSRILDNKFFTELSHDVPPEEGESFEYNFEKSLFPKQNDIQVLVDQYFKFMTIIDSWKEEEINQFVNEDEETTISEQYRELSDIQKREIFDDFVQLKQIVQNFDEDYKKEKQEELRKKLGGYGITGNYFDKVIEYYVKNDKNLDQKTQHQAEKVKDIIICLSKIEENEQFSTVNVIDLYKSKNKFNYLPAYNEIVNILIADKNIQINISETVINILKTFYNSYNKYQIKFNNLKEAFNDKTFLYCLVIQDIKIVGSQGSQQKKFEFKDENYVFRIIKKLIQIEYTAPYIASLIIKVQSDKVIERNDLRKLIEILLEKDSYIIHLIELLSIENTEHNLYEEVCNKMLEKKDINVNSMDILCKESKPVKEILGVLKKRIDSKNKLSDDVVKLTKEILRSVNNAILYWCYQCEYKKAKEIADLVQSTYDKLKEEKLITDVDPIVVWHKLNSAKVMNFLGSEAKRQDKREEATEYYNKAMVFLKEVPSEIDTEQFLLVLSREAYTKSLLQEFEESYEKYENLWKEIVKFALYLTKDIPRYDKKISIDAIKSQRYVDLLALSNEHKKYLDILEIRMSMGFQKEYQKEGGKKELNRKVAYEIYKEVYNIQKLKSGMEIKSTLGTMRRMAKLNYLIANEKYTKHKYKDALRYYYESLAGEIRILKIQEENYSKFHPVIRETNLKFIKKILDFIAQINDRLGDLEQQNKLKENTIILKYYNTAQTIFDKLYDVDKHNLYLEKSQKIIKKIQNLKQSSTRKNKREWNLEWTAKRRCLNN